MVKNAMIQDYEQQTWQQVRLNGLSDYQSLTEATKELDAVAAAHHPDKNHFYYSTFINMIYKELFNVKRGDTRGLRNRLTIPQLKKLHTVERHTAGWIREGLAGGEDYHQVYYRVHEKVRALVKKIDKEEVFKEENSEQRETQSNNLEPNLSDTFTDKAQ